MTALHPSPSVLGAARDRSRELEAAIAAGNERARALADATLRDVQELVHASY